MTSKKFLELGTSSLMSLSHPRNHSPVQSEVNFHDWFQIHMNGDTEKMNLRYISKNLEAPILKYLCHNFLSGLLRDEWWNVLWLHFAPFLESLELFMINATLFWTKMYHFVVKILSQSCSFWCTRKKANNRQLKFSKHKISVFPPSSKVFPMILWA